MGGVESLVREEVALLLATLAACGLLVLGTLELIWPTRPRRSRGPAGEPPPVGGPPAPVAGSGSPGAPEAPPIEDRAAVALRVGRTLLDRALADPDPASDGRLTLLCRAIACLDRGIHATPEDLRLHETLAVAREALARADEQVALRRLAAEMPWHAPALAHAGPAA